MIKGRVCAECRKWKVFSKGLCQSCWKRKYGKKPKKVSDGMRKTLDEYSPNRKTFLEINDKCQLKLEGCTYYAECVHHKKGKHSKDLYLDQQYWMASCIFCNGRVEEIGQLAYDLGLKIRHNTK